MLLSRVGRKPPVTLERVSVTGGVTAGKVNSDGPCDTVTVEREKRREEGAEDYPSPSFEPSGVASLASPEIAVTVSQARTSSVGPITLSSWGKGRKMAQSTCIKCEGTTFEVQPHLFHGDRVLFFQCSRCGGVVGIHEAEDLGALLGNVLASIGRVEAELGQLQASVR
jgi:hypothetical protein